ncbi:hypothetical protein M0R45_034475 [Rubus argutus]|uniref:Uncharacterized protein n=1 Tax=Rubus argutus TaxID=59490 RepID=A0AAW1VR30_RUBAR
MADEQRRKSDGVLVWMQGRCVGAAALRLGVVRCRSRLVVIECPIELGTVGGGADLVSAERRTGRTGFAVAR